MNNERLVTAAAWLARIALAATFLSAVADRFGLWGPPGAPGVAWGNVANYETYAAKLNWYLPPDLQSPVAWTATAAEVVVAFGLLAGWRLRWFALAAALLLTAFAVTMTFALGPKKPLDFSVFSAAAAAYLLAAASSARSPRSIPPSADHPGREAD